jgi:trans-aconitate 2-methyltransferase
MTSPWNPDQYARFRNERSQPFLDMLELVQPASGGRAVDLGCGTGELTPALHARLQARETVGLDSSESMLAKSGEFAGNGVRFERGTIESFAPAEPFDVVFSNAALQWVDGHEELFPRLAKAVAAGGQLAVQMPANDDHPSHLTAHAVAREEPFATALGGYSRTWPVKKPEWYAELLDRLGFSEQSVRLQVYGHHLASRDEVVEWVKGTLLTDYQKRMPPETYEQFLKRYRERLMPRLEDRKPYFYAFKRVLVWGRK